MATTTDWLASNTDHGLLVAFGEFLQQHGLIHKLMDVPIKQKTVHYAPGNAHWFRQLAAEVRDHRVRAGRDRFEILSA